MSIIQVNTYWPQLFSIISTYMNLFKHEKQLEKLKDSGPEAKVFCASTAVIWV